MLRFEGDKSLLGDFSLVGDRGGVPGGVVERPACFVVSAGRLGLAGRAPIFDGNRSCDWLLLNSCSFRAVLRLEKG